MTAGMVDCRKALDLGLHYAAIALAYVVTDGVLNFVCGKRSKPECRTNDYLDAKAACLHRRGALSDVGFAAVRSVFGNIAERNNFLHFNPTVERDPSVLKAKAEEKCAALETLLSDLFACTVQRGVLSAVNRELWPRKREVAAYIDFEAGWRAQGDSEVDTDAASRPPSGP